MEPKEEKKVEYVELIYDLIFVYIVGRNNELLHTIQNGFIAPLAFLTYVLTALIMLQIWYATTLFINRYGKNDRLTHISLFINMYLLYYMAQGIRTDWQGYYLQFNISWALILLNLAGMYFLRLKTGDAMRVWENRQIKVNLRVLLIQAAIVLISLPVFYLTGIPFSPLAMLFGIVAASVGGRVGQLAPVEFSHLTERVMLYVVFTFGEMIIGIAGYFSGEFSFSTVYFSLGAFLIVVGLFTCYGILYDQLIDREMSTNGTGYMLLHVFLILSLNHITAALEFMREEEVSALPKNLFLILSLVMFFVLLYFVARHTRPGYSFDRRFRRIQLAAIVLFVVCMLLTIRYPYASLAVTVIYIAAVYFTLWHFMKKCRAACANGQDS